MRRPEDDRELLRDYADRGSEAAFARVVAAHADVVYSSALRQLGRADLAEDVTQAVFVLLARKARDLPAGAVVGAWLYRATRFTASAARRAEARRRAHERKAGAMAADRRREDHAWARLAPLLDEGVARLRPRDRDAVVLRFFHRNTFAEVGAALGISEGAAQMRVARSLEKLRGFFFRRGVVLPAVALAGAMSANAVRAAPPQLAASLAAAAMRAAGRHAATAGAAGAGAGAAGGGSAGAAGGAPAGAWASTQAAAAALAGQSARAMAWAAARDAAVWVLGGAAATAAAVVVVGLVLTRSPNLLRDPAAAPPAGERTEVHAAASGGLVR